MNTMFLKVIIQTMPKTPANEYRDAQFIVKSREAWKKDRTKYITLLICSVAAFFLTDKFKIPYIGNLFFFFGIFGFLAGLFFSFRAIMVYKYYYDIYKEEDIKKLEQ